MVFTRGSEDGKAKAPVDVPDKPAAPRKKREPRKPTEEEEKLRANEEEINDQKVIMAKDRLKFLLQQTEIFGHFIHSQHEEAKSRFGGVRRHRMDSINLDDDELLLESAGGARVPTRLSVQPACITGGDMRAYQLEGLNWLIGLQENGINGILADEMGLGKTLQTISLLGYMKQYKGIPGPHLVVAPKSTLLTWRKEVQRWCPSLVPFVFIGNKEKRETMKEEDLILGKFDVCITSYEIAIRERAALRKFAFRYLVVDEAHRIKNEQSLLSQVLRLYTSQYRLLLTGTPLQNNLHELWALLNFLLPDVFSSATQFDSWFNLGDADAQQDVINQLHRILRPFLLRRVKAEVENLPPKKEILVMCGLSAMQKELYRKVSAACLVLRNPPPILECMVRAR